MNDVLCYTVSRRSLSNAIRLATTLLSDILIDLPSFEPAGGIVQAASLNCSVTKRLVAWSRNCRCASASVRR